jgi:hypothetical protein
MSGQRAIPRRTALDALSYGRDEGAESRSRNHANAAEAHGQLMEARGKSTTDMLHRAEDSGSLDNLSPPRNETVVC